MGCLFELDQHLLAATDTALGGDITVAHGDLERADRAGKNGHLAGRQLGVEVGRASYFELSHDGTAKAAGRPITRDVSDQIAEVIDVDDATEQLLTVA